MIRIVNFLLAVAVASASAAQTPAPPVAGPGLDPARRDLWQMLTPEQRDQLWRSLSTEQRTDLWRGLEPQERREIRERLGPPEVGGRGRGNGLPPSAENLGGQPRPMMTFEERQKMREQIREAHRLRREQMEQERRARMQ